MATAADPAKIASHARRLYLEELLKGLPRLVAQVSAGARELLRSEERRVGKECRL